MEQKLINSNEESNFYHMDELSRSKNKRKLRENKSYNTEWWQIAIFIIISLAIIFAYFFIPWINLSKGLKINVIQFNMSIDNCVDFLKNNKSLVTRMMPNGLNVDLAIQGMTYLKFANYITFMIPILNIILIIIMLILKKPIKFIIITSVICIFISLIEIYFLGFLTYTNKVMMVLVYEYYHTNTFQVTLSMDGYLKLLAAINNVIRENSSRYDDITATVLSSSFFTVILSFIDMIIASAFYFTNKMRKK